MSDAEPTTEHGEIREPENSTVENWTGQAIARDEEVAERAAAESDDMAEAEERFEAEASGEEEHRGAYPPPGGGEVDEPA